MAYNTGKPVPSRDPRDLIDNAESFDIRATSREVRETPDRLGVMRKTWHGIEQDFAEFLVASGFEPVHLTYQAGVGLQVDRPTQLIDYSGSVYRVKMPASFPVVLSGTWAADSALLVDVGDQSLRSDLIDSADPAKGAALVAYLGAPLPDHLATESARLDDAETSLGGIQDALDARGSTSDFAREGSAYRLSQAAKFPQRVRSKTIPSTVYDHFGVMDLLPNGELISMFRRGVSHEADPGKLSFTRTVGGVWRPVQTIAEDAVLDYRGAAGGVMPNGRVVAATAKRTPGVSDWRDMVVYVSDDYGVSWELKASFEHNQPLAGRNAYGKGRQIGNKYVIPYYGTNFDGVTKAGWYYCSWIESSDGGETWTQPASPAIFEVDASNPADPTRFRRMYNETDILPLGGGYVYAVSRIGNGDGGEFRHWLSIDNGSTWADRGLIPPTLGHEANRVVSPSLEYVVGRSGRPHVMLLYTDRTTSQCVYRTCLVDDIIADNDNGWSSSRGSVYSAPIQSGYQTTVNLGNRIIGNVYRETTLDAVSGAYQFEIDLTDLPDYDSGFTAVGLSESVIETHGLQRSPSRVLVEFSPDATGSVVYPNACSQIYDAAANKGVGALVSKTDTLIAIRTGGFALVYGTVFGSPTIPNITTGYMRVRAWL